MAAALEALHNETMGYTTAVKHFEVPSIRFKNEQISIKGYVEAETAKHIVKLESMLFEVTGTV